MGRFFSKSETTGVLFRRFIALAFLASFSAVLLTGCNGVRRRLHITSDPPGATAWVNDQQVGQTPISVNVLYSGTYKIRLSKDDMETQTVMHRVRSPWYLWPGVDFFSENLVPGEIRDNQTCHVKMTRRRLLPPDELLENATKLRTQAHDQANLRLYQGTAATMESYRSPRFESAQRSPFLSPDGSREVSSAIAQSGASTGSNVETVAPVFVPPSGIVPSDNKTGVSSTGVTPTSFNDVR